MNRNYAETYEEHKSGKYEYVKGYGRLGCYQGLDYIENILKDDKYYSEELEDGFIFIQSYINCVEQQCKRQKEVIDRILNETKETRDILNNNRDDNMLSKCCLLSYLEIVENLLKEVSE